MVWRRVVLSPLSNVFFISPPSNLYRYRRNFSTSSTETGKTRTLARRAIPVLLISLTGGLGLSALDDLLIYHQCSSKAIEKAVQHQSILDAIGEPILRGPWYNASLAVAHRRNSVSCTFPVTGPQGTGIFQLKAMRNGDDTWFPYLRHRDWDILIMEALFHVPANEEHNQTFRIRLTDCIGPASTGCVDCTKSQESRSAEKQ